MYIDGTTVYNEGVEIKFEHQIRIRQISRAVRALSQTAKINMKLLKCQNTHEVLLWGMVNNLPLGIYSRGLSLGQALDSAAKKLASYCAKASATHANRKPVNRLRNGECARLAMAS
jgi:hypothetical protein